MSKENMYIVFKRDDALKYLTEVELQFLEHILCTIEQGRTSDGKNTFNKYYVCNVDEPYAQVVHGVIIGGEEVKKNESSPTYCPDACGSSCSECFSDYKNDTQEEIETEITWKDMKNNVDDCVTICKKNGLTVFRIIESRYGYYADYYDNTLFNTPNFTYHEAGRLAKEKFSDDSMENRLKVAKEFFLENYEEQVLKRIMQLGSMRI